MKFYKNILQKHILKQYNLENKEILPSDQSRMIKETKFSYSSYGKVFEKQTKTIKYQYWKQFGALKILKLVKQQQKSNQLYQRYIFGRARNSGNENWI